MRPDGSHRKRPSGPPRWSAAAAAAAARAPGPDAAGGKAANAEGICSGRPPAPGPSPAHKKHVPTRKEATATTRLIIIALLAQGENELGQQKRKKEKRTRQGTI